jgi:hypothetical protein
LLTRGQGVGQVEARVAHEVPRRRVGQRVRVGMQGGVRIVERRQHHGVEGGAQVGAVGRGGDFVQHELQRRWRWVFESERRLAHFTDADANGGDQLGQQPRVVAVEHLELVLRFVGDSRDEHTLRRARNGV